ncbi:hypothetical protein [Thioalkalivibrio thiocyanodenitrificans]|uniref:hypothetical protein n=1 Tax=Thioalkalivibrio thiocyanodenitrificans TaxID=243063 RepID=UPI00037ADCA3|nr:hypothetical protein [Thioalkalivibrio thiocyanodenitrificans]
MKYLEIIGISEDDEVFSFEVHENLTSTATRHVTGHEPYRETRTVFFITREEGYKQALNRVKIHGDLWRDFDDLTGEARACVYKKGVAGTLTHQDILNAVAELAA